MADRTEAGLSGSKLPRFLHWAKSCVAAILGPRRTTITIETERTLVIRRQALPRGWCPECGRESEMIGPPQAAIVTGVPERRQHDFAITAKWHMAEATDGSPMICLVSLLNSPRLPNLTLEIPSGDEETGSGKE
jgi:hypothetical protein